MHANDLRGCWQCSINIRIVQTMNDDCHLQSNLATQKFNDVSFGAILPLDIFKKLTDRYPFRGAIKGGFTWLKPKVIVFTSNSHPRDWYPYATNYDKAAIKRRITKIVVVK